LGEGLFSGIHDFTKMALFFGGASLKSLGYFSNVRFKAGGWGEAGELGARSEFFWVGGRENLAFLFL
jgi:hypothetical protein